MGEGLSIALSTGLSYWLLFGLYQGISDVQIEDHDRLVFNQGIRRSFHNSGFMGIISGVALGSMGILGYWLRLWLYYLLNGTLSYWSIFFLNGALNFVQHYGWLLAISGGLLACSITGGLAVLRHYSIRFLLWRANMFPWQVAPFLKDSQTRIFLQRVGGGYGFAHRLLLDYFADGYTGASSAPSSSAPSSV